MKSAEYIKKYFQKSTLSTNSDKHEAVFGKILRAYEQAKQQQASSRLDIRMIIMKSNITKFAAAAVIIIAVLISINKFSGPIDLASRTFAATVENVNKAKTISWTATYIAEGKEIANMKTMVKEPYFMRIEVSDERIMIFNMQQRRVLVLNTKIKGAFAFTTSTITEPFNTYDTFKNFRQIDKFDVKHIGTEIISNRKAEIFELTDKNNSQRTKIWVDPQTELPFRMESNIKDTEEKPIGGTITISDIVFDEEMDISLFSLDIPEGYKITDGNLVSPETGRISKLETRVKSATNMDKILKARLKYANEHSGQWPDNLKALADYGINDDMLINPEHPELKNGYIYLKPQQNASPQKVVIYEAHDTWNEGINVAFFDGHIEFVKSEDDFNKMLTEN
jgi:prepilin-type processing-associated H-X9-DG protein